MRSIRYITHVLMLCLVTQHAKAQVDCQGVVGGSALPGTPCYDWNDCTTNDHWDVNCDCVGTCPTSPPCNDGNALTINDHCNNICWCVGAGPFTSSCTPGTPCNDFDPLTSNDTWTADCDCFGGVNTISGQVFLDLDADGVLSGGDLPVQNRLVSVYPDGFAGLTGADGTFTLTVPIGTFTLVAQSGTYDQQTTTPPVIVFANDSLTSTGHILAMGVPTPTSDIFGWIGTTWPRPGFTNVVNITAHNVGTTTMAGSFTFTFDSIQTLVSCDTPSTVVNNTIEWTVDTLLPGGLFQRLLVLYTDSTTAPGLVLSYTGAMVTTPADMNPANDYFASSPIIVASCDPNDKLVQPALLSPLEVADGTPVVYTIRFQNTGTYQADRVRIEDQLPAGLDPATFVFMGSSHACQTTLIGEQVQFLFDPIALPDSTTDEPNSHGYVRFRITPVGTLQAGDSVVNRASIYFDFNMPVITPPSVLAIDASTELGAVTAGTGQQLWPNPAANELNLAVASPFAATLRIIDVNGREVFTSYRRLTAPATSIGIEGLAEGLYTLRIDDVGRSASQRFVVQR